MPCRREHGSPVLFPDATRRLKNRSRFREFFGVRFVDSKITRVVEIFMNTFHRVDACAGVAFNNSVIDIRVRVDARDLKLLQDPVAFYRSSVSKGLCRLSFMDVSKA